MKVLVIQLARLGDIYSMWPSLRAFKRNHPMAEIDLLLRPRFSVAAEGLDVINEVISLPQTEVFSALLNESKKDSDALADATMKMADFVTEVRSKNYDKVINLSFSPVSSFLTKLLEGPETEVLGYTRQEDGFLRIPDDASAYFYAQMGIAGSNRFHVNDVFSEVMGVELVEEDYHQPVAHELPSLVTRMLGDDDYVVFHVGASNPRKALSALKASNLLKRLVSARKEKVVLVGSVEEQEFANKITESVNSEKVVSFVGKTKLVDLFPLIRGAKLLVGADSAPIHIASLVATPVYNLSNRSVRFWETGPKAAGSRIRMVEDFDLLGTDMMCDDIEAMLDDRIAPDDIIVVNGPLEAYHVAEEDKTDLFRWKLVEAIYLGKDFPVPNDLDFVEGVRQLQELNGLSLQQFHAILKKEDHQENMNILGNVDDLVEKLVMMLPDLGPIVKWYQTEKLRVGPVSKEEIVAAYTDIHTTLANILSVYLGDEIETTEERTYEPQRV